ncbi:MAG TPA: beta-galactosidase [Dysgonamonadaceae bacterium]|nr:beta-galactosidase [Dysgonamonadaceae bacterium]
MKFGQWKLKEWEGKIEDENELVESNQRLKQSVQSAKFPVEWSKYGGWKKLKFESTGFFRTHHDGRRWWLVDPEGYGFLSVGVDVIGKSAAGPIDGIEDLFSNLPEDVGSNIDFYQSNMARAFGSSWQEDWEIITSGLMKKLRMNTVGNWSDLNFAKRNKIPYVLAMSGFPSTEVLLYRDLPDVFSSEYQQNSIEFARQLEAYKNDPYLIGYFLSNEPGWALGDHNLAYEMFRTNEQSKTKDEFVSWIASQYGGDINAFNKAWNLSLEGFEELKTKVFNDYSSKKATSDFYEFSSIIVRKYIDLPCDEIEKIDNNHLNLGMRYAWLSSELLYMAGERFDVFSINGYGMNPPETEEITRRSGKPVLIGEFHHGAIDRALPATGITGVMTQQDRADAYRNYVEQGLARPELIGMHYFQWIDHPFTGRFDGENYNIGVVSLTNIPYPELSEAMTLTNERIYKVGSGMISPYKKEVQEIPTISY